MMTGLDVVKAGALALILAGLGVLAAATPAEAQTQVVLVQARENGQGILRARGRECFVITPQHVVGETAAAVGIVAERQARATSQLVRLLPGDLAILRVDDATGLSCDEWLPLDNFAGMLRTQTSGTLIMREADGSRTLLPVVFASTDDESIFVRPARPQDEIAKTMSGAALLVNGALAGVLLSVEAGVGTVYQLDDVMRVSAGYFEPDGAESAAPRMEVTAATTLLDRAVQARDGSAQGQTTAIAALLAAGHQFNDVDWSGVNLGGAMIARANLSGARLHFVNLAKADARGANLSGTGLRFAHLDEATLTGAILTNAYAPFVDARNARLEGADLSRGNFLGGDFRGAHLDKADLRGSSFAFADLRGAVLDGADLTGAYFPGAVFDETTSLAGATLVDTDLIGAAAGMVTLTDTQRAGACRHDIRLPYEDAAEWNIRLLEQWPNPGSSTGLQFDDLMTSNALIGGFGDRSLPLCQTPIDTAAGYYAPTPGEEQLNLDRAYLAKAGRRTAARERVAAHLALVSDRLGPTHILKGDGAMVAGWHETFRRNAARVEPLAEPYITDDQMLLLVLKMGLFPVGDYVWRQSAEGRFRFENDARKLPGGLNAFTAWPSLFPDGSLWEDLPEDRVEVYRAWTEARVAHTPLQLVSYSKTYRLPANRVFSVARIVPGDSIRGYVGIASWFSGLQEYARDNGIATERVLGASGNPGLARAYFVMDQPADDYKFEVPADLDVPNDARFEVVLTVARGEVVSGFRGEAGVLFFVTPGEVRIRTAQGTIIWKGRVTAASR
ncbi:MAG: pentapeptide repeat-containing protein [Vicinamibacterales bacterium]